MIVSVTVSAALKKIAVDVLMGGKSKGEVVVFLLTIVCVVFLPLMGVQAVLALLAMPWRFAAAPCAPI